MIHFQIIKTLNLLVFRSSESSSKEESEGSIINVVRFDSSPKIRISRLESQTPYKNNYNSKRVTNSSISNKNNIRKDAINNNIKESYQIKKNKATFIEVANKTFNNQNENSKIQMMRKYSNNTHNMTFESKFQSETVNRSKGVEEKDEEFPRRKLRKRCKSSYHSIQKYVKLDVMNTECKIKLKRYIDSKLKIEQIKRLFEEYNSKTCKDDSKRNLNP